MAPQGQAVSEEKPVAVALFVFQKSSPECELVSQRVVSIKLCLSLTM